MKARALLRVSMLLVCAIFMFSRNAGAEEKVITSGACESIEKEEIPVGNFLMGGTAPEGVMRITQKYNTTKEEGFYSDGVLLYGHDGLDIHEQSAWGGKNNIYSVQDGIIVASHKVGTRGRWGETVIIATRTNEFSEEILTFHYHHLHYTGNGNSYVTTRRYNACDIVNEGTVIAKEGGSGGWPVHLHWSVRRWENFEELKAALQNNGAGVYGPGYTYGDDAKIAGHLDPERFHYHSYLDYASENGVFPDHFWSFQYAAGMRQYGIEFGEFDGRFGAGEEVLRREAARWVKIAAGRESKWLHGTWFVDVPPSDPDHPYIEALTRFPYFLPVINKYNSCKAGGKYFCPDESINRAEALKMVITAFYGKEYLEVYKNDIWASAFNTAVGLLSQFVDVDPVNWYASYVYFGAEVGLIAKNQYFHPANPIKKEEVAKWIVRGYKHRTQSEDGPCMNTTCPLNFYCEPISGQCYEIPECVPTETSDCEVGGGYEQPEEPDPPEQECSPGETETQSCNNGTGTQTRQCDGNGNWNAWGACTPNQSCQCSIGTCCDGCNYLPATTACDLDYVYQCQGNNPGQNAQKAMVKTFCSGNSSACSGQTVQYGWQTLEDCSQSQVCEMNGGMPECVGSCQDVYQASQSSACYNNPQGAGNPTLCLYVTQVNEAQWKYKICKQGGAFQQEFNYQLRDENHLLTLDTSTNSPGSTCTPWKTFHVTYIPGYGAINGAGVAGFVTSPAWCSQSSCQYRTGGITIQKTCN